MTRSVHDTTRDVVSVTISRCLVTRYHATSSSVTLLIDASGADPTRAHPLQEVAPRSSGSSRAVRQRQPQSGRLRTAKSGVALSPRNSSHGAASYASLEGHRALLLGGVGTAISRSAVRCGSVRLLPRDLNSEINSRSRNYTGKSCHSAILTASGKTPERSSTPPWSKVVT